MKGKTGSQAIAGCATSVIATKAKTGGHRPVNRICVFYFDEVSVAALVFLRETFDNL